MSPYGVVVCLLSVVVLPLPEGFGCVPQLSEEGILLYVDVVEEFVGVQG